ncbi:hypothetical protein ACN28I_17920 [Archangium gephyra]|uniref:hypothetical protein n=1 Tax=Archangium gephyra TaxID=48 RepID=UPI003B792636
MRDKPTRPTRKKARKRPNTVAARKNVQAVAPLEFDPFTPGREHPEWVKKNFPTYVEHRHENLVRSDRVLEHRGNTITITTMYEVRVEGRLVTLHMMVDEEGRLWSHLCPYLTFATATGSCSTSSNACRTCSRRRSPRPPVTRPEAPPRTTAAMTTTRRTGGEVDDDPPEHPFR